MGELRIRDISDDIIWKFKDRARKNHSTLQAVLHEALARDAMRPQIELAEQLQRNRDAIRAESGEQHGCTAMIREERENRW